MVSEAPSNWLSRIIEEKREAIDRVIPALERRAVCDAIVEAIRQNPKGEQLLERDDLGEVIMNAVNIADDREREAKKNPRVMTASPAIQASWFVFEELGLPLPGSSV